MNSLKNDTSSWNTVLNGFFGLKKKTKTMVTSDKKWSVNLQYYDFLFALLHIKFVMSIRQEIRIHKMPQTLIFKITLWKCSLSFCSTGEVTVFVLFSLKEDSTVARSAIFSTPSTSLPEAIFFSPPGHNQLPLESLGLSSTGVVVSTHWAQLLRLGLVLVRD